MALLISTGYVVVEYGSVDTYWVDVVEYGTVDPYWGGCGRERRYRCCGRSSRVWL